MNKSKIFMIVSICILCVALIGTTIAYYTKILFDETVSTITHGLDYYINYQSGQIISTTTLNPSEDYTGGAYADIELWKIDDTYDIYGHIYLDITTMSETLSDSEAVKYAIINNNELISAGTIKNNSENTMLMIGNIPLQTTKQLYTVYIWLDKNGNLDTSLSSSTLSLSVRCEATMKEVEKPLEGAALHIANLYLNNKDEELVVNNSISYRYASIYDKDDDDTTSGGLMNDRYGSMSKKEDEGNIRYYGANPSNYIYFNCSDYSNQSESTCEVWRIIGVFNGKVKIMRNSSIGYLAWDQDKNQNSNLTTYNNDWSTSSLQEFLNGKYYDRGEDTTYTYYSEDGSSEVNINLEEKGIKNNDTRKIISENFWYLKGWKDTKVYPNQIYNYERNLGEIYNIAWPTKIFKNIGIPYASDYGYAADFNSCEQNLYNYDNSACKNTNWMKTLSGDTTWLITARSTYSDVSWKIVTSGYAIANSYVNTAYSVFPVLHLNSELDILSGDGSEGSPYKLAVN